MPGIRTVRKRPAIESEDESDNSYASTGSKRARRDEEDGDDIHGPGSLVRVKLTNFVTYTAAEFHLGPSLNMIIGPNGTGKSTLVCAICLGLGWSPQHLGRAKDIGEFVKYGQPEAEIEIELAASENQRSNPVVRRIIRKEGNKSAFFIGGRPVPQKEVVALARSFSIQIDNLCQFLPQDRVVEFARLDPIALLRETLRAAAPEHMVDQHDQLKDLHVGEKTLEVEQDNEKSHLKQLQDKQNATREDVARWNERHALSKKKEMLEKCRPIIAAKLLKAEVTQIRTDITANKEELRQYEKEIEPVQRAQQELEQYRDEIDKIAKSRKQRFNATQDVAKSFLAKIESQQQRMDAYSAEIQSEKETDKQRKQDAKRAEMEIKKLQGALNEGPVQYDASRFESRHADIRYRKSAHDRRRLELHDQIKHIRVEVFAQREALQEKKKEAKLLDTQFGQKANLLKRISAETATAWDWLEKNKESLGLQGDVYGPPLLSCSVPNAAFADAVESQLRRLDYVALTCTNNQDARIIQDKLTTKASAGGLELHEITVRTVPNGRPQSPISEDELLQLGFESWIIDHIVGPEPVLAMLCESGKLHAAAYTSQPISQEHFDTLQKSKIRKWVSGKEVCQVSVRAEYGASSTSVMQLKPAQYFTGQSVDTEEKQRLDQDMAELELQVELRKSTHKQLQSEIQEVTENLSAIESEKTELQSEQDRLVNAFTEWQNLPRKIEDKRVALQDLRKTMAETHNRVKALQTKCEEASVSQADMTLQHAKHVMKLRAQHEDYVEAQIRLIEANSEIDGYISDNHTIKQSLDSKKANLERLGRLKQETMKKCKEEMTAANRVIQHVTDAEKEEMLPYTELSSADALDEEISTINSRLDMMAEGNPNAVKAYEKREQDIKAAQEKLDNYTQQLEATRESIREIREQWEPELDDIVSKISDGFSHNFQKIKCAGQVGVYKDEDFEKWAIQIQVRFRENESLSILDSHRQSGGERAVSTIFYLMALQDLARSPFRVVDEINQGMDPRNERMVHERMVDIACRERTSQYFLVTPKLLNDLKFHPKMKVHCIASGEHMPDQKTNLDFQSLARVALRVRKGIAAA